jgi:predicted enzyme related to lactoylglutathione lyase
MGVVRTVVVAVDDMDAACRFYENTMGLVLKFRDGSRWAAFDAGAFTLALAGEDQKPLDSQVALNVKVSDVAAALERASAGGALVVRPAETGAHEVSGAFRDPTGLLVHVYSPRAP